MNLFELLELPLALYSCSILTSSSSKLKLRLLHSFIKMTASSSNFDEKTKTSPPQQATKPKKNIFRRIFEQSSPPRYYTPKAKTHKIKRAQIPKDGRRGEYNSELCKINEDEDNIIEVALGNHSCKVWCFRSSGF
jgi:hypothetical protein